MIDKSYSPFLLSSIFWLFIAGLIVSTRAEQLLPHDMHLWAIATIDNIYRENFKLAEEESRKIIKKYPAHPAGYFFMAATLDSWMSVYQSNKKEDEFFKYCDLAEDKGEKTLQKNPKDEWAKFFMGGAEGYKGTYEARYERWITAFRYGWKGVSILTELKNQKSSIVDISYGIGSYEYWRSALMKSLWWMPCVEDKRNSGIEKIYLSRRNGIYTKIASSVSLIDILLNEKRYKEALEISDSSIMQYPDALLFILGKARSLSGVERFEESNTWFQKALKRIESYPDDNHFNAALSHLGLAKNAMAQKKYNQAIGECNIMTSYPFDDDIKKRLDKYLSEANSIKKQVISLNTKSKLSE